MGHRNEKGVLPRFLKRPGFEGTSLENENQELINFYDEKLPYTRNKKVSWKIAHDVGEHVDLYFGDDWKLYACALGIDEDISLRRIERSARCDKMYPLTKFLLETFHHINGNLGDLLQVLIDMKQYSILKLIKPLVEDCLIRSDVSSETICQDTYQCISVGDEKIKINLKVDVDPKPLPKDSSEVAKESDKILNRSDSSTENVTNNESDEGILNRKLDTQLSSPSIESSVSSPKSFTSTCAESLYSMFTTSSSSDSMSSSAQSTASSAYSVDSNFRELFVSLSCASNDDVCTAADLVAPNVGSRIPIYSTQAPVFVFITHTSDDRVIAEEVALKLRAFGIIGITQFQLLPFSFVNHEDVVSKILREIDFTMPIVSEKYMQEISVPEDLHNCTRQQLSVRNIFTALQADFFNNASLNWKIRPVVVPGVAVGLARQKQELRCALRLWDEWDYVISILRNTVRIFKAG